MSSYVQVEEHDAAVSTLTSQRKALREELRQVRSDNERATAAALHQERSQREVFEALRIEQQARLLAETSFLAAQDRSKVMARQVRPPLA